MKKIIKLLSVALILATIVLSTSSCGVLTMGLFSEILNENAQDDETLSPEEEFYELVCESKDLLDQVSGDVNNYWYLSIYEGSYNRDADKAIDAALKKNEENINRIHENDERIVELYQELYYNSYSYMMYEAEMVVAAYNTYYTTVMEVDGKTYDFYSDYTQYAMLDLSIALKNYATLL